MSLLREPQWEGRGSGCRDRSLMGWRYRVAHRVDSAEWNARRSSDQQPGTVAIRL